MYWRYFGGKSRRKKKEFVIKEFRIVKGYEKYLKVFC